MGVHNIMSSAECAVRDQTFGPWAGPCRGGFDFTLYFESTILSIIPLAFLIVAAPLRIQYLLRRTTKVVPSSLLSTKLVSDGVGFFLAELEELKCLGRHCTFFFWPSKLRR